ncbi:hypothetical protein GS399_09075 [Pedobacter sp. HMF7647]|uniref:Beta-lactamase-inhibitor-like PepSY-like domain-containing protein n=1 Tax=Hufsiella arboris TaxID=2695275 RepID=A0A7K1YAI1_9SPHI|nr:hypothetical protein [Hufsiella arboris]MXV51119.1 hypothetical protein [Hufsiella arboris]
MKKLLITLSIATTLTTAAFADIKVDDKGKNKDATTTAQYQFAFEFKNAKDVEWTVTPSQLQKATFTLDGVSTAAFYNMDNEHVATTQYVDAKELPANAVSQIQKYYKGYTIGQVVKYIDADPVYFVDLKNDKEELLISVTKDNSVGFFKQIK